ncbi:lamin tail domain-containing protein [Actinoplanes oblitus]|uniref:Lamin tail domain-containing protein n=1 Tax=Actinoplanes oblitus TaxID=3040509 RepID=A0ABY8WAL4_9ACTN|nr:lamin tail domain-containing protein [Actinoplanes oblitus]WIM94143.1 lamin tail domain-containing protein [Actinoplanes oblitus]
MLRRLASLATAVTAAATLTLAGLPAPALAASVPCRPVAGSPRCSVWTGKVAWVADGDTLLVDVNGDGTTTPRSIRVIGVQAMEQHVYSPKAAKRRGDCHALEATARVERLVRAGNGVVRMTAQHADSQSRNRPLRSISVKINGTWRDIGEDLVRHGYALWLPFAGEWAWDSAYELDEARASTEKQLMWDENYCGAGPAAAANLTVWANSDADGDDGGNLNGEWIRIGNHGSAAVDLSGWWVRDSGLRRYTFTAGTVVPAGGAVYVHVGQGVDTATDKYWGLSAPIFTNVDPLRNSVGDGAYLFDPQGDLRRSFVYPCQVGCGSPLAGKVSLKVKYGGVERVEVVNVSDEPVDLQGHVVVSRYQYRFEESTVLAPGESMVVPLAGGRAVLDDRGGEVRLQTSDMWTVACRWWGTGKC